MLNSSVYLSSSPWLTLFRSLRGERLPGLLLALGILVSGVCAGLANGATVTTPNSLQQVTQSVSESFVPAAQMGSLKPAIQVADNTPAQAEFPADGTYLYGESVKPDQLGKTYLVFEVRRGTVVGAFYVPYSSFDCFYGSLESNQLALTIVDSYERTTHPYAIALQRDYAVASTGRPTITDLALQGYHPLSVVSANDQRMLNVCKADYQKK